jgi:hypothetical protein
VGINMLEEHTASILRVEDIVLMMQAVFLCETLLHTCKSTQHQNQKIAIAVFTSVRTSDFILSKAMLHLNFLTFNLPIYYFIPSHLTVL